jgi:hypothetical protein
MVPKVFVSKTGERIIAGLSEVADNDTGKGICLNLKCPYILTLNPKQDSEEYSVNFSKWNPFSTSIEFNVPYDYVVGMGDPEQGILDVYLEKFGSELYYEERENVESEVAVTEE